MSGATPPLPPTTRLMTRAAYAEFARCVSVRGRPWGEAMLGMPVFAESGAVRGFATFVWLDPGTGDLWCTYRAPTVRERAAAGGIEEGKGRGAGAGV